MNMMIYDYNNDDDDVNDDCDHDDDGDYGPLPDESVPLPDEKWLTRERAFTI